MGILHSVIFQPPHPSYKLPNARFQTINSESNEIVYYCTPTPSTSISKPKFILLFSHGNAEDLGEVMGFFENCEKKFENEKYFIKFVGYDYAGYGKSSGNPSEKIVFQNATDVLNCIKEKEQVKNEQIIVYGRSLGSGPTCFLANEAAKEGKPFLGVILQSPLMSIFRVGINTDSSFSLPFDLFCNYERITKHGGFNSKTFIIHGERDRVVPFTHGVAINKAILDQFRYPPLFIKDAGHNDIHLRLYEQGETLEEHLFEFINNCVL